MISRNRNIRWGLSLTELMVTFTLIALLGGMLCAFISESSRSLIFAHQKLQLDNSVRVLSEILTRYAGQSDGLVLYQEPNQGGTYSDMMVTPFNQSQDYTLLGDGDVYSGSDCWGDLIVFIKYGDAMPNPDKHNLPERPLKTLHCIARTFQNDTHGGKIWHYEVNVLPEYQFTDVSTCMQNQVPGVLGGASNSGTSKAVPFMTTGHPADNDRMAFFLDESTLIVNVEAYLSYREETASVSYNFVVKCPRQL